MLSPNLIFLGKWRLPRTCDEILTSEIDAQRHHQKIARDQCNWPVVLALGQLIERHWEIRFALLTGQTLTSVQHKALGRIIADQRFALVRCSSCRERRHQLWLIGHDMHRDLIKYDLRRLERLYVIWKIFK